MVAKTKSAAWYEQWQNANPGCTIEKSDYSRLLDKLSENESVKASDLNQAGAMTDKDGTAAPIIIAIAMYPRIRVNFSILITP